MPLPQFAGRRPVAVSMLFLAFIFLGLISFTRVPIDLLPAVSYPRIVVYTSYPEVAPAEVERLIISRVEAAVASAPPGGASYLDLPRRCEPRHAPPLRGGRTWISRC